MLDAVRYHSVGLAEWDMVGRTLYCADFLEPGRGSYDGTRAALAEQFPSDPQAVLFTVAQTRMRYLVNSGSVASGCSQYTTRAAEAFQPRPDSP